MKKFTIAQPGFELGTIGLLDRRATTELLLQKGYSKILLFTSTFFKIITFYSVLLQFSSDSRVTSSNPDKGFDKNCPYS